MSGKSILITGSTGFIGRNLIATDTSHTYIPLTRDIVDLSQPFPRPLVIPGVDRDTTFIDTVIHLAIPRIIHQFDPITARELFMVNVSATQELLEYAHGVGAWKFIYMSSGNVEYETDPSFYTVTKKCGEKIAKYYRNYMHVTILRPIYVYGVGQEPNRLIPKLIRSVQQGDPVYLNGGGTGNIINPVYIDDMVSCMQAAIDFQGNGTIVVSGSQPVSLWDIAEYIGDLVGKDPVFEHRDDVCVVMEGEPWHQRVLFQPKVSWQEGIKRVVDSL
jgi:nucleoside-diphosphate-sugar epimerase